MYLAWMFLILFDIVKVGRFSQKQNLNFVERQAFTSFKPWLLPGLRKMLTPIISNTKWCHSVGLSCNFIRTCLFCFDWQMLLPLFVYQNLADVVAICLFVVDVKPLVLFYRQMLLPYAVCYCHFWYCIVTDVIVTCCLWLMLLWHYVTFC